MHSAHDLGRTAPTECKGARRGCEKCVCVAVVDDDADDIDVTVTATVPKPMLIYLSKHIYGARTLERKQQVLDHENTHRIETEYSNVA